MRTPLLFSLFLLVGTLSAQTSAGDAPPGTTIIPYNTDLVETNPNTAVSTSLELDCDDQPELSVVLFMGQIAVDLPNVAWIELIDPGIELCMDLAPSNNRPKYYALGQLLDCSGDFDWQSDSINILGDYGGFGALGPGAIMDRYIAYRLNGQVGWIRLSFNLQSGVSVQLQVHEALELCPGSTGIGEQDEWNVSLFPNPSSAGTIRVESTNMLQSIEVLDPTGKMVARYGAGIRQITAPEAAGIYFVRALLADGRRSITRLVRN